MKKNQWISLLLAICSFGCMGIAKNALSANAEEASQEKNKTLMLQSGYKSGMFAPISPIQDKKGATIEFDLYTSDFKELNYDKSFDIMSASGTSGGLAAVSFVFGKDERYPYESDPNTPAWHISNTDLSEFNFGGFLYFCNGQILERGWQGGNAVLITNYIGSPSDFMEEGYSYKVGIRYDQFEYEGETYGGNGGTWFYAERKGLFAEESDYELIFAFQKQMGDGRDYTNGTIAGMETLGLCKKVNIAGAATSADGKGYSVNMEIDDLRIYDGTSYEVADKKYSEDFEQVTNEQIKLPDMTDNKAKINQFGDKKYLELPSGIRNISANYGDAIGNSEETTCRLGIVDREVFTVTFKDKDTNAIVGTQKTYPGFDFSDTKFYSGEKAYKFDYSDIDFSQVNKDIEVYGTPVTHFMLRLIGGVGISEKSQRVGVNGKFVITEDLFVRDDYDLIGFTTKEGGVEVEYKIGSTFNMRMQDRTLYAVWQLKSFSTVYKSGVKTLYEVTTGPKTIPFYYGGTPTKAGYVFAGWSAEVAPSQNQTLTANFVAIEDANAENKAVSVKGNLTFKHEGYDSFKTVDVSFDLITLPQNATVSVLGKDITEFVSEGYRFRASVSASGKINVYKAYIGLENYELVGTTQTEMNTNSYMELAFDGDVVFDTLTMRYDGTNTYEENFEGIEAISEGIYNNYYTVEGAGEIVPLAKDKAVTFIDETTGREVSKTYTYAGGNVMLVDELAGVSHEIVWDKTQEDLCNVQNDITVTAELTWNECTVSFVVNGVFNFIEIDETIDPIKGIYGEEIELPTLIVEDYDYAIIGWTDEEKGNYAKYVGTYVMTQENGMLYAVWGGKPITVEFYAEDGTTLLETQTVEYKDTVIFGGEIPEKVGYKFVGWDKSTVGVTENTKFVAVYEKIVRTDVMVSVLGGNGAGRYVEGDVVTISFREIAGFTFTRWNVVSGGVTIEENNGVYTFVVGAQDVVVEAVVEGNGIVADNGCDSSMGAGIAGLVTLCGAMFVAAKRRKEI